MSKLNIGQGISSSGPRKLVFLGDLHTQKIPLIVIHCWEIIDAMIYKFLGKKEEKSYIMYRFSHLYDFLQFSQVPNSIQNVKVGIIDLSIYPFSLIHSF